MGFYLYTSAPSEPRQEADTPARTGNSLSITRSDPSPRDLFVRVVNNAPDTRAGISTGMLRAGAAWSGTALIPTQS